MNLALQGLIRAAAATGYHRRAMAARPRSIRFCTAGDGTRIAYSRTGHGPPIVKSCMWLNDIESEIASPVWGPWIALLNAGHELIGHDLRGCGLSDRLIEHTSLQAWVGDMEAVVESAGLERVVIVGLSQGAAAAIAYAARHPEKVAGLIICGGYTQGLLKRDASDAERELGEALAKMVEFGWGSDNTAFRQVFSSRFFPDGTAAQIQWMNAQMKTCTTPAMAARILRAAYKIDVSVEAQKVTCPTLVLHSRMDAVVPFESGRVLAGLVPGARLVPLSSSSHLPMVTEPAWQLVQTEVTLFLAQVRAASVPVDVPELAGLSARELQVLEQIARGRDNAHIAATLGLANKTIRNHVTSLFDKLGVATRAEAIVLAREAGLGRTDPAPPGPASRPS